ncbi:MAG: S8 family peptidase [Flavobacteriaceae bacterium]
MKGFKPIYAASLAALTLAGCASVHKIPVPAAQNNAVDIPTKNVALDEAQMQRWSHMDLATDTVPGMSIPQAYDFLQGKEGTEVIVGVIDSGIDVEHEDLAANTWTNPDEVAGNGIDDDKNGYVDDIKGWNFIGGPDGNVYAEQLEITRMVKVGMDRFGDKTEDQIAEGDLEDYKEYIKVKAEFDAKASEGAETLARMDFLVAAFDAAEAVFQKDSFVMSDFEGFETDDAFLESQIGTVATMTSRGVKAQDVIDYRASLMSNHHYDLDFDARKIVGDDPYVWDGKPYGNNQVGHTVDDEIHGTHVAGIIAAVRNNDKGMNGVATNVKILSVRAVPDGDERDKDVAMAFRYAVDNGAKVINTSFGKAYSPDKEWVYDALKYAAEHDVLIVNAAGNDGANIDEVYTYPNDSKDLINEFTDNVLTIGAMSANWDENMPAGFSNYGKLNVDIFAPGVAIYATFPDERYEAISGTSMAAPSTAGVAALIRSYYPELSASQVKHIIMNSGTLVNMDVVEPGSEAIVPFADLSVSGRIVNAYNALKMADQMVNGK